MRRARVMARLEPERLDSGDSGDSKSPDTAGDAGDGPFLVRMFGGRADAAPADADLRVLAEDVFGGGAFGDATVVSVADGAQNLRLRVRFAAEAAPTQTRSSRGSPRIAPAQDPFRRRFRRQTRRRVAARPRRSSSEGSPSRPCASPGSTPLRASGAARAPGAALRSDFLFRERARNERGKIAMTGNDRRLRFVTRGYRRDAASAPYGGKKKARPPRDAKLARGSPRGRGFVRQVLHGGRGAEQPPASRSDATRSACDAVARVSRPGSSRDASVLPSATRCLSRALAASAFWRAARFSGSPAQLPPRVCAPPLPARAPRAARARRAHRRRSSWAPRG